MSEPIREMIAQCHACSNKQSVQYNIVLEHVEWKCEKCDCDIYTNIGICLKSDLNTPKDVTLEAVKDFRPKHYEKGHDTFAWAEHKFDLETNINICRFNIHRYNDRDKGQDVEDFEKIIAYAQRALDLIKEDKQEVTFDEQS